MANDFLTNSILSFSDCLINKQLCFLWNIKFDILRCWGASEQVSLFKLRASLQDFNNQTTTCKDNYPLNRVQTNVKKNKIYTSKTRQLEIAYHQFADQILFEDIVILFCNRLVIWVTWWCKSEISTTNSLPSRTEKPKKSGFRFRLRSFLAFYCLVAYLAFL